MRILLLEMRKHWGLRLLPALAAIVALVWPIYMSGPLQTFQSLRPGKNDKYFVLLDWAEKYGSRMDAGALADAEAENNALAAEMNALIAQNPVFTAHGAHDLDSFYTALWMELPNETQEDLAVLQAFYDFLDHEGAGCWRVWETESLIGRYRAMPSRVQRDFRDYQANHPITPAELARYEEVVSKPDLNGLFFGVSSDLQSLLVGFTLIAVLSTVPLLANCGVRERLGNMRGEQWASRTGRGTAGYQLAAALLSATVLWLAEVLAFGGMLAADGMLAFWGSPVMTFAERNSMYDMYWFDFTFGGYLLASAGLALALMLGLAGVMFSLSYHSGHTVSVLLKALVPTVGYTAAAWAVSHYPFSIPRSFLYHFCGIHIKGIEAAACATLCAAGLSVGLIPVFAARRKELL